MTKEMKQMSLEDYDEVEGLEDIQPKKIPEEERKRIEDKVDKLNKILYEAYERDFEGCQPIIDYLYSPEVNTLSDLEVDYIFTAFKKVFTYTKEQGEAQLFTYESYKEKFYPGFEQEFKKIQEDYDKQRNSIIEKFHSYGILDESRKDKASQLIHDMTTSINVIQLYESIDGNQPEQEANILSWLLVNGIGWNETDIKKAIERRQNDLADSLDILEADFPEITKERLESLSNDLFKSTYIEKEAYISEKEDIDFVEGLDIQGQDEFISTLENGFKIIFDFFQVESIQNEYKIENKVICDGQERIKHIEQSILESKDQARKDNLQKLLDFERQPVDFSKSKKPYSPKYIQYINSQILNQYFPEKSNNKKNIEKNNEKSNQVQESTDESINVMEREGQLSEFNSINVNYQFEILDKSGKYLADYKPIVLAVCNWYDVNGKIPFSLKQLYEVVYHKTYIERKQTRANLEQLEEALDNMRNLSLLIEWEEKNEDIEKQVITVTKKQLFNYFLPMKKNVTTITTISHGKKVVNEKIEYKIIDLPPVYEYAVYFNSLSRVKVEDYLLGTKEASRLPSTLINNNVEINLVHRIYLMQQGKLKDNRINYVNFFENYCGIDYLNSPKMEKERLRNAVKITLKVLEEKKQIRKYDEYEDSKNKKSKQGIRIYF